MAVGNCTPPARRPRGCDQIAPMDHGGGAGCPLGTLVPIEVPPDATTGADRARRVQQASRDDQAARDEAIVKRAQAGDRDALEALLRRHYDQMYTVCRRMTGNDADAADAAQEALIAVTRGLPRFDNRSRFSTWAYRIAVNCSIDELRRRSRRPVVSLDEISDKDFSTPSSTDPEGVASRIDIDNALRELPPDFRAAVVLRDLCGLDYAEIAEVLQVPAGTVRSRIARGRGSLVRLLDPTRIEP